MRRPLVVALVVALVIVAIAAVVWQRRRIAAELPALPGMWTSPAAFLQEAALDNASLFIDNINDAAGEMDGYLVMSADGQVIANTPVTVQIDNARADKLKATFDVTLVPAHGALPDQLAAPLHATMHPTTGALMLQDASDEVVLFLYRDNEASAAALESAPV